jgi:hypothetical protein
VLKFFSLSNLLLVIWGVVHVPLEAVFFFHFCKVASVATSNVQLVLLWLKASWCKSSLRPHWHIIYINLAVTPIYMVNYLTLSQNCWVKKAG